MTRESTPNDDEVAGSRRTAACDTMHHNGDAKAPVQKSLGQGAVEQRARRSSSATGGSLQGGTGRAGLRFYTPQARVATSTMGQRRRSQKVFNEL
jgi:hypothetical protein